MMLPKANGGTTMCNLVHMNTTCLMKMAWAIRNEEEDSGLTC